MRASHYHQALISSQLEIQAVKARIESSPRWSHTTWFHKYPVAPIPSHSLLATPPRALEGQGMRMMCSTAFGVSLSPPTPACQEMDKTETGEEWCEIPQVRRAPTQPGVWLEDRLQEPKGGWGFIHHRDHSFASTE